MNCPHCDEPVLPHERAIGHAQPAHAECILRAVTGSVAHLLRECSCYVPGSTAGDPPGMTQREAAKAAAALYHAMVEAGINPFAQ